MEIISLGRQQNDGPAYVQLKFPDTVYGSQGLDRVPMNNPRRAWESLAKKHAAALGIDIAIRLTEDGLEAAFYTHHDCSSVLAAVDQEWPEKLRGVLRYWANMQFRLLNDPMPEIKQVADSYDLELSDVMPSGPSGI